MISDFSSQKNTGSHKEWEIPAVQSALDKTHQWIYSGKLQNQKQKIQDDQFLPEY